MKLIPSNLYFSVLAFISIGATSCSVVPKSAPALETLERWHDSASLIPASAPRDPFNSTAGLVNARISSLQQAVNDEEPLLVTTVDFSEQRLADIKAPVESYLQSAPRAPADAGATAAAAFAQWLLKYAKAARKDSADAARKRLEGYRWKVR